MSLIDVDIHFLRITAYELHNLVSHSTVSHTITDATLDGSDFENTDMSLANVEMAQFNRANLKVDNLLHLLILMLCDESSRHHSSVLFVSKNAILKEMYVSGATLFEGVKDISGSDWTDTELRKDQKKYLCGHPTATGTNPVTGVDTRESLMCQD